MRASLFQKRLKFLATDIHGIRCDFVIIFL